MGGRITAIAVNPNDSSMWWAASASGGLLKTVNNGADFTHQFDREATVSIGDVQVSASNPDIVWVAATGNLWGASPDRGVYKTTDGGATWKEQFRNKVEKAFYDAIACWDRNNCIAMSDPVDGKFLLINTKDGGTNWRSMDNDKMPSAKEGEAAFAASGTCLITQGKNNVFLVTGGSAARVFRSNNRGLSWLVADTPIVKGTAGSGIFSIAMFDEKNGVIVGGNYEKPDEVMHNLAVTSDGGRTWKLGTGLTGYRSAVGQVTRSIIVVAGTNGSNISYSGGNKWAPIEKSLGSAYKTTLGFNAVASFPKAKPRIKRPIWAVGPNGLVVRSHTTFFGE